MPKIVRKKMCFLGERVRAGVEPALCVKEWKFTFMPACMRAIHPADDTRSLWCAPEWLLQLRGILMACPGQCRIIGLAPICRLRTGSAASKRDSELIV